MSGRFSRRDLETGPLRSTKPKALTGHILLDEKAERRLRRIRWRRTAMVVAVLVLMTMAAGVYVSPLMRVRKVEVVGATTVNVEEIESLAALDGDSLFRLDTSEAQERIGYLPMVQSVTIERNWPHTVRIEVHERQPWGFWQVGADRYVIDAEGVVLPEAVPADGAPLVNALSDPVRLLAGDRVDRDAIALTQTLLQRVPETLATSLTTIEFSPDRGLVVGTDAAIASSSAIAKTWTTSLPSGWR